MIAPDVYPHKVEIAAKLMRDICDLYIARSISKEEFEERIEWFAVNTPSLIYKIDDYRASYKQMLGKTRLQLVHLVIGDGAQLKY